MKKLWIAILALVLCLNMAAFASAAAVGGGPALRDDADLLTDAQETRLRQELVRISQAYGAQVAIVTVAASGTEDMNRYVEDLYREDNYGAGSDRSGVLLLVCMDPRQYRIRCEGFAADAITLDDSERISDWIQPELSSGDYVAAFETFTEECEYYLNGYINGYPFDPLGTLMIAVPIGLLISLVVVLILKGQLKSVRQQRGAVGYVKPGSMQLTFQNDLFLYRNVTRTKIQTSSGSGSSGGGRSGHTTGGSF